MTNKIYRYHVNVNNIDTIEVFCALFSAPIAKADCFHNDNEYIICVDNAETAYELENLLRGDESAFSKREYRYTE